MGAPEGEGAGWERTFREGGEDGVVEGLALLSGALLLWNDLSAVYVFLRGVFGGSLVSIGPSGELREGLFVDFARGCHGKKHLREVGADGHVGHLGHKNSVRSERMGT